jgi:hypothetical protein
MAFTLVKSESYGCLPEGTSKIRCVCSSLGNEEPLHRRNVEACQTIHNYPGILERMLRSVMRRVEACIESH